MGRLLSGDVGNTMTTTGAPFEDLKRRLATINGSASSLATAQGPTQTHGQKPSVPYPPESASPSTIQYQAPPVPTIPFVPPSRDRPGSPTESVVSTANSTSFMPLSRLQIGGNVMMDVAKAAPAVGSSKMNAVGLLDAHSKLLRDSEGSPERSGRSSPVSASTAIRPPRSRFLSVQPISTYGRFSNLLHRNWHLTFPITDGQDPGISHLLESLYLDNNRELQNDFGPRVHEGPMRRRAGVRHTFTPREGSSRRTEVTVIANLASHSEAITALAVSPDHMFFISASDDKTVKIWDTTRLERNVTSKPRHTYGQHHARVKCICILEATHCFASAADDGSVHVVRVHVTQGGALPKYGRLQVVREYRVDSPGEYVTCMVHYNSGEKLPSLRILLN